MTTALSKPAILIVEDEAGPRDALKVILRPFYAIHVAESGHRALQTLREHPVDLITLDQKLPDCQGIELLQQIKHEHPDVEVIIITGYGSLKSAMDGIRHGAAGYLLKPFNVTELITLINQTLEKKKRLDDLREFLKSCRETQLSSDQAAELWKPLWERYVPGATGGPEAGATGQTGPELVPLFSDLLEARSRQLLNHASRVSFYATLIGTPLNLSREQQKSLSIGGFLHDIGFLVLDEPGPGEESEDSMTRGQRDALRRHAEIGAALISPLAFPAEAGQIISYHHERYDGTGYPLGLHGGGIPLLARIVSIANAFDNLLTGRHAARPLSVDEAIKHITAQAGTAFDPEIAATFATVMNEYKASLPALGLSPNQAPL